MSWLKQLETELVARGVTGRRYRRIVLELQDHINCEPGCEERLGNPRALAIQFAEELAADGARRSAFTAFGALAVTAAALLVLQVVVGTGARAPNFDRGHSLLLFWPAVLAVLLGPQVALVAGVLAVLRAVRRRRAKILPVAEIALIRRRVWVGLAAGIVTALGLELYLVDFSSVMPAWRLELVGGVAGVAAVGLLVAALMVIRAGLVVTDTSGSAGDIFDDLPAIGLGRLRRHPWFLGAVASLGVGLVMTLFEWHAERSLVEGLQRGAFEAIVAAVGFLLLGRAIGVTGVARQKLPSNHRAASG